MKINNNHIKEATHLLRNRKTLGTMLKDVWKGHYKMTFYTYIVAVLAIAYAIFPLDILPDFIPVIGWVDDGILLFIMFQQLKKELLRYNEKHATADIVIIDSKIKK